MIARNSYRNISLTAFAMLIALAFAGCSDKNRPMTTLAPKSDLAKWIQDLFVQGDALGFAGADYCCGRIRPCGFRFLVASR